MVHDTSKGEKFEGYISHVRYSGIFDLEGLYKVMIRWFKERNYFFHEHTYKYKPDFGGKTEEVKWYCEREEDDYVKSVILIYFHIWDIEPVEVIKDGKKKRLFNARMDIRFTPIAYLDWQGKWEKNRFTRWLRKFYHQFVIKKEIDNMHTDAIHYRVYKLQRIVKEHLEMESKGYAHEYVW